MESIVVNKSECKCGAITLTFDNGAINSMRLETYNNLPQQYHILDNEPTLKVFACNHCCNGWGIEEDMDIQQELEVCMPRFINFGVLGGVEMRELRENDYNIESYKDNSYNEYLLNEWYDTMYFHQSFLDYIFNLYDCEWENLDYEQKKNIYNDYN